MKRKIDLKKEIFTLPNWMSLFRICLIPAILLFYVRRKQYLVSAILIGVSAVTDIADGIIARHFGMVSELGKLLDPLADKLTQGTLMLCLISRLRSALALIVIFCVNQIFMLAYGYVCRRRTSAFSSARWYGKANTVILESIVAVLVIFPLIPTAVGNVLLQICCVSVLVTLVLYSVYYHRIFLGREDRK